MVLESIGFLLGAEASSVPRGRALALRCSQLTSQQYWPQQGRGWEEPGPVRSFRHALDWFGRPRALLLIPNSTWERGLCLQLSLPFMLVTHTIDAGASITSQPSEPGLAVKHQFLFGSWDLPIPGSLWETLEVWVPSTCTPGFRGACFLGSLCRSFNT